jgi:hypothetical protein
MPLCHPERRRGTAETLTLKGKPSHQAYAARIMRNVHLVGSVPLADRDAVFHTVAATVGPRLKRYSDGETGPRADWVQWQRHLVVDNPDFTLTSGQTLVIEHEHRASRPYYTLAAGVDPASVVFPAVGYAEHARASYTGFRTLRDAGVIPARARFLVAIPTPLAFLQVFIAAPDRAALAPAYERSLLAEVAAITAAIPAEDLAIQWDSVFEILVIEGARETHIDDSKEAMLARLQRLGEAVPPGVDLGYHFCYGDMGHRHSLEPPDMSVMVEVTSALGARLKRAIDYVHMPVPRDRSDDAYFAPLEKLALDAQTELYLGLVHMTDGEAGGRRRIAAAERVRSGFGIGTECGFGRRPPETIVPLLELHRRLAAAT